MTASLLVSPCLSGADAASAQIIPSSAFSETGISSYAFYHCGGHPGTNPCDDIVVNCDAVEVQGNGVIKAVAWSSSNTGNTTLYVEDYAGNSVTIPINNFVGPDVVIAASTNAPNYPYGSSGYQVCLVYDNANGTKVYYDAYDLYDVGLPSFYLKSAVTSASANMESNTPTGALSSIYSFTGNPSYPHIDMWTDTGTLFNGDPSLHQFVYTWSDGNNVIANVADIAAPSSTWFLAPTKITSGVLPDVAAFTDVASGDQRFILSYSVPATPFAPGQIQVYEYSLGGTPIPAPVTVDNANDGYYPRIEALSQYDGKSAKWQIASTVPMSSGPQAVYGYNDLLFGPTDFSSILSPLYPYPWGQYAAMGACVAGGVGVGAPSANVGNRQYTVGFYPWQHDSLYARDINISTGQLITPSAVYQVNNDTVTYHWDRAINYAISNCSNTGKDIFAAWYNGRNVVYKYSSANAMLFRQLSANASTVPANAQTSWVSPNPASDRLQIQTTSGSTYIISDIAGKVLLSGRVQMGKTSVDVSSLVSGLYLIRLQQASGSVTNLKFNKQ